MKGRQLSIHILLSLFVWSSPLENISNAAASVVFATVATLVATSSSYSRMTATATAAATTLAIATTTSTITRTRRTMLMVEATSTSTPPTSSSTSSSAVNKSPPPPMPFSTHKYPLIIPTDIIKNPPWISSSKMDENGFITKKYHCVPGVWESEVRDRRWRRSLAKSILATYTSASSALRGASSSSSNNNNNNTFVESNHQQDEADDNGDQVDTTSLTSSAAPVDDDIYSSFDKSPILTFQTKKATIRQVPGDGSCLFHAISVCYAHAVNGTHLDLRNQTNVHWLYQCSAKFRQMAVDCLEQTTHQGESQQQDGQQSSTNDDNNNKMDQSKRRSRWFTPLSSSSTSSSPSVYLQGQEYMSLKALIESAAEVYGVSPEEYCRNMRKESYWGGGPEVVALSNILQRPIHVYELATRQILHRNSNNKHHHHRQPFRRYNNNDKNVTEFVLQRMASFGSPNFDRRSSLHILSADSRFPDLQPGQQGKGNHFLAVFPEKDGGENEDDDNDEAAQNGDNALSNMILGINKWKLRQRGKKLCRQVLRVVQRPFQEEDRKEERVPFPLPSGNFVARRLYTWLWPSNE